MLRKSEVNQRYKRRVGVVYLFVHAMEIISCYNVCLFLYSRGSEFFCLDLSKDWTCLIQICC